MDGNTMRLTIESLAYGGQAVAHAEDGRAVFVPYACPGDVIEARETADHKRYLEAQVVEVVEPSVDRVTPPCSYFGACGGCQWQHVSYAAQTAAKRRAVADTLQRIGRLDPSLVEETRKGDAPYGYRNKVEFCVVQRDKGPAAAYSAWHGGEHVAVQHCHLLPKKHFQAPKSLTGVLRYLGKGSDLGVARIAFRSAAHVQDVSVDLWSHPGGFPRALAAKAFADSLKAGSVTRVLARDPEAGRKVVKVEVLGGKGAWRERLLGFDFLVSAPSFFQVNTPVAERLASLVAEVLSPASDDRVLDLYAGVGTFTLPLARDAGEVVAVESSSSAAQDLDRNLDRNRLDAVVAQGDAAEALQELGRFDLAVVDPPRAGMGKEALEALLASAPRRIAYVSCDPATLARDSMALAGGGYDAVSFTPLDMFPQTYHVETVAVFDRRR